jgi:hypothetical protein
VRTDFSPQSIKRLQNIAGAERLASAVRRLCIGDRENRRRSAFGGHSPWPRLKSGHLDLSSTRAKEFRQMIARFTNCTGVTLKNRLILPVRAGTTENSLRPVDTLQLVLSAAAAGCLPHLRSLRLGSTWLGLTVARGPYQTHPDSLTDPPFRTALATRLRDLEFRWEARDDATCDVAVGLVAAATELRVLKLNFALGAAGGRWLRRFADARLPQTLEHLNLQCCRLVEYTTLRDFLGSFKGSLKSLWIDSLHMSRMEWCPLFASLRKPPFPKLASLTISSCIVDFSPRQMDVLFCFLGMHEEEAERECGAKLDYSMKSISLRDGLHSVCRINGVRFRGQPEGAQRLLGYLEETAYALASPSDENESPYLSLTLQRMRMPGREILSMFRDEEMWDDGRGRPR